MASVSWLKQVLLLSLLLNLYIGSAFGRFDLRSENGLAITPPMGWNTYNHYSCSPNEAIVHSNAKALVHLGLKEVGYHFVTVDCGWTLPARHDGNLTWNPALFPNGYPALGRFIHGLGLGFGVYSDGGIKMCMNGALAQNGSLGHEITDAKTFAGWGVDLLKYDNCFSDAAADYPDVDYTPDLSPSTHYKTMASAILNTSRPIVFQICDWGVDFPSAWAPNFGNSWRTSNDINPSYSSIPRILNQIVPQTSYAGPGRWLDLDMLEVGNNVLTIPEEQTHFSLWAIIKSPLIIGCALEDAHSRINDDSLSILNNTDVIGYNQDSMGIAASFRRRWTSDHEIWAGPLSGGRTVVAVINLQDIPRNLTLDLPDVGFQKAGSLRDIWNGLNASDVLSSYTGHVEAHGTLLLELANTIPAGNYNSQQATKRDPRNQTTTFTNVYGVTTSSNYSITIAFTQPTSKNNSIIINSTSYTIPQGAQSFNTSSLALIASNENIITITSSNAISSLSVAPPQPTFYPSSSFQTIGNTVFVPCAPGLCIPVGSKIGNLSSTGSASLNIVSNNAAKGPRYIEVFFCNDDIAFASSFSTGTNTRNMTIGVNNVVTRIEVPLSGNSSELYSPGLGWEDTGVFGVLTYGWISGVNNIVVGNESGDEGLVSFGADFVGLKVY